MSNGKPVKKSTKVPVAGGLFRGEKLTRAQAKNQALMVAQELANAAAVEAERVMRQPMLDGFYQWARERYEAGLAAGGDAAVYVLPRLRVHSNPSQEFTQLVRLHGIGLQNGGGAGRRKCWHSKTLHCLRASVATMLQAAGVSLGLAMELVGHDSTEVHAVYIRPNVEQLRHAVAALPQL